jgi:threonine dehydrogenase-like Zn-dependent dehydrogenase
VKSRAVVMNGTRSFEVQSFDVPRDPPDGGAIMRVIANGLCGSDWDLYSGALEESWKSAPRPNALTFPLIPGHEMVGEIVEIDEAARQAWKATEGDRIVVESMVPCGECEGCRRRASGVHRAGCENVFIYSVMPLDREPGLWGGMAEYMVLRRGSSVFKVPEHITDLDASLFNPLGNAFCWTYETGKVSMGERVLILGHGQRGLMCSVVAKEAGASTVIVAGRGRSSHKLQLAPEFGATDVVDVDKEDVGEAVMRITGGKGVDLIVDTVPGSTKIIEDAIRGAARGCRLALAGIKGANAMTIRPDEILTRGLTIMGAGGTTPWSAAAALRVIAAGNYPWAKLHTHTFGLDEADRAVRILGGEIEDTPHVHVTIVP